MAKEFIAEDRSLNLIFEHGTVIMEIPGLGDQLTFKSLDDFIEWAKEAVTWAMGIQLNLESWGNSPR
jgi:hypothetical protein